MSSDPHTRTLGKEFENLVALGSAIVPLVVEKLAEPDNFLALQLYDAIQTDTKITDRKISKPSSAEPPSKRQSRFTDTRSTNGTNFTNTIRFEVGTSTNVVQPGRDHWPNAMAVLLAGGGMRTGQVIGSTNSKGEHPQERPLSPNDLWATVYRHLGLDPDVSFPDHSGRLMPILPFGEPIAELLPA